MSSQEATVVVSSEHVIENPLSGERIVIRDCPSDKAHAPLTWELTLAPGGRVPSRHVHPAQEERFTVLDGRMRFLVGGRRRRVGPGETVTVPPGTVHHFANDGPVSARVLVETTPALNMEAMLATAAALARDQQAAARRFPRLLDLALFMRDFDREVRAPYVPVVLLGVLVRPVAWLARRGSVDGGGRRHRAG